MSIKSEKAKAAIKDVIPMYVAEKAVELAESDARERAARVFCDIRVCRDLQNGFCPEMSDIECEKINQFLEHYDNETN